MVSRRVLCAAVMTVGLAACSKQQEAPRQAPPPDAKRVDPATASKISGRVSLDGALPENAKLKMGGDPACDRAHKDGASADTYVGENGGLGNVFVYVKSG